MESHTSVLAKGVLKPQLCHYRETNAMTVMFKEGDLVVSIGQTKATCFSKSTYASWIRYYDEGEGSQSSVSLLVVVVYSAKWERLC